MTIRVGGALEFAVADGAGHVYVNVEDKDEVAAIDTRENRVLAHWPTGPATGPTGLALDVRRQLLFAGCGNRRMAVLDARSGKLVATVDIGDGVDGVAFNPTLDVALSANGKDGTVSVVRETSPGTFEAVQSPTTVKGARTIVFDAKTMHALLPCHAPDGKGGQTFGIAVVGTKD